MEREARLVAEREREIIARENVNESLSEAILAAEIERVIVSREN